MSAQTGPQPIALEDGTPVRLAVQCRRCEGWIHNPASVKERIGPVCARHERAEARQAERNAAPGLFPLPELQPAQENP